MFSPEVILIIRFSSIGDIVLTTSVAAGLRHCFPAARIDFLTLSKFAPLLENHPDIDRLITIDRQQPPRLLYQLGRRLRLNDYDLVMDLHNSLRSKLVRKGLGAGKVLVFKKPRLWRFLLFNFNINRFPADYSYLNALNKDLRELGLFEPQPARLELAGSEKKNAGKMLKRQGVTGPYIVFIPGAAWPNKCWLPKEYARLAGIISDKFAFHVVLLGTSGDKICDAIAQLNPVVTNLAGRTSIRESLAVIAGAGSVVGSDTGLVHGAEALGVDAVMICGPTSRETGAGVNRPGSINIQRELWCRPCSQNGRKPCRRSQRFCLDEINADQVITRMRNLIAS